MRKPSHHWGKTLLVRDSNLRTAEFLAIGNAEKEVPRLRIGVVLALRTSSSSDRNVGVRSEEPAHAPDFLALLTELEACDIVALNLPQL